MQNYKKILLAAVATLAFGTQAMAADKLKIGTEGAYPPFNFFTADGQLGGFDIEIGRALCAQMKAECTLVQPLFCAGAVWLRPYGGAAGRWSVASIAHTDPPKSAQPLQMRRRPRWAPGPAS